jgi:hypothetical protein
VQTHRELEIGTVKDEVEKAKKYVPQLTHFIVATTSPSDAVLQMELRKVKAPFKLSLWSWDEINNHLNRLPGVALDYVQSVLMGSAKASELQHATHLREALDRPALLYGAHAARDFVVQLKALKDTSAFLRTGLLYTRTDALVSGLPYRRYSERYADAPRTGRGSRREVGLVHRPAARRTDRPGPSATSTQSQRS